MHRSPRISNTDLKLPISTQVHCHSKNPIGVQNSANDYLIRCPSFTSQDSREHCNCHPLIKESQSYELQRQDSRPHNQSETFVCRDPNHGQTFKMRCREINFPELNSRRHCPIFNQPYATIINKGPDNSPCACDCESFQMPPHQIKRRDDGCIIDNRFSDMTEYRSAYKPPNVCVVMTKRVCKASEPPNDVPLCACDMQTAVPIGPCTCNPQTSNYGYNPYVDDNYYYNCCDQNCYPAIYTRY